jgi:hypothetical protein
MRNIWSFGSCCYALAIAAALKRELREAPGAIKTVMGWTGATERTVKNWIAGTHGPSGEHLIVLAHHSHAVMVVFHQLAKRPESIGDPRMGMIRKKLTEALDVMDQGRPWGDSAD